MTFQESSIVKQFRGPSVERPLGRQQRHINVMALLSMMLIKS
jgi:hypothetical protein